MERDFRSLPEFLRTTALYEALLAPGGHVFSGRGLCGHENAVHFYFIGQSFDQDFEAGINNRLYCMARDGGLAVRLNDSETRQIRLSPNGKQLAVACAGGEATDRIEIWSDDRCLKAQVVPGLIEQIDWSADGSKLLMVVAGAAADLAGIHGGYAQKQRSSAPAWIPEVRSDQGGELWRAIWTWDGDSDVQRLTAAPQNVWEAAWCGSDAIAAIVSDHHSEGSWYRSVLTLFDATSSISTVMHRPVDQIGCVKGSPDGRRVAFIQAICSDRGIVHGQLCLLDRSNGTIAILDTLGTDVASIEWRSDKIIHFAGLRGHETVAGDFELTLSAAKEISASTAFSHGEWGAASYPIGKDRCLFIGEAYARAPFLAEASTGSVREVASLAASGAAGAMGPCGIIEPYSWTAPDGLEIQGWVVRPRDATGPTPLLVDVHGGPISAHRNRWMVRGRATPLLASVGWTIFFPNPRGSTGRGDAFARSVKGDMGGADVFDIISGVDALVARGWADNARIAVTGTSYGGFMSAWLPSQSERFAAAIPVSPVGNWYSQHRTSQIPEFDEIMLVASPWAETGAYFKRSPAFFKHKKKVPSLVMAGAVDRSTAPSQAEECYFAAVASGSPAELVIYPNAGHSVRKYAEYLDSAARVLWWLDKYVHPAG
ncbi:hypothetical protein N182_27875 [Sinorhizobium sp. GL2]|nr:hypothetical protein N182_27875 [Sinorhizobium sp. GL2]